MDMEWHFAIREYRDAICCSQPVVTYTHQQRIDNLSIL